MNRYKVRRLTPRRSDASLLLSHRLWIGICKHPSHKRPRANRICPVHADKGSSRGSDRGPRAKAKRRLGAKQSTAKRENDAISHHLNEVAERLEILGSECTSRDTGGRADPELERLGRAPGLVEELLARDRGAALVDPLEITLDVPDVGESVPGDVAVRGTTKTEVVLLAPA